MPKILSVIDGSEYKDSSMKIGITEKSLILISYIYIVDFNLDPINFCPFLINLMPARYMHVFGLGLLIIA